MDIRHQNLISDVKTEIMSQLTKEDFSNLTDEAALRKKIELLFNVFLRQHREYWLNSHERQNLLAQVTSDIWGLGPIERLLHDPEITEIMVNGPSQVYIEKGGKIELTDVKFKDEQHMQYFVEKILSPLGRHITKLEPYVDARLGDGSRVNIVRNPVSLVGTIITIRKFSQYLSKMDDLIKLKTVNHQAADFLAVCVRARINIVISGSSGSGKTTMLNTISNYIPKDERVIIIEDTAELNLSGKHSLRLETRPPNIEGKGEITIRQLVKNALHMRPDRVIVGEVRSNEVLDMLQAMTTGHEGSMTTLHSNSAFEALDRLEMLTLMDNPNISPSVARRQIVNAVDLVIHMVRLPDGSRKVSQVAELLKDNKEEFRLSDIFSALDDNVSDLKFNGLSPLLYSRLKKQEGFRDDFFEKK